MRTLLRDREPDLRELMDDPDCDPAALERTYARFALVNPVVSGWRRVYREHLRPLLAPRRVGTLLDVGSGGGDVARSLARWAARDGLSLAVTAADPDPRAHAFASRTPAPGVTYRRTGSAGLVAEGASFDVVVSNHLLHHLDEDALTGLLADSAVLARRLVVHSDLARSRAAYAAYGLLSRPLARGSFLRVDGMLSIRRSYTAVELARRAGPGWRVERRWPSRLLLLRGPDRAGPT